MTSMDRARARDLKEQILQVENEIDAVLDRIDAGVPRFSRGQMELDSLRAELARLQRLLSEQEAA
jgi:hypothetical protein